MLWYENLQCDKIYNNLNELLSINQNLKTDEAIIFFVNFDNGFGSNLTVIIQNALCLKQINPKLHCLGHFSNNKLNFKYHEETCINSFFLYFNYLKSIPESTNYYFVRLDVLPNYPFIQSQNIDGENVDSIQINKVYSNFFKEHFQIKIGKHIIEKINVIKNQTKVPLIGVHIRSFAQIFAQNPHNVDTVEIRLQKLKTVFDSKFKIYNVFLATDVEEYIQIAKKIFNGTNTNVYYNDFVNRIESHGNGKDGFLNGYNDSVINLEQYKGFKLGSDIIYDCLSLISCDYYYVSVTNIAFITSFINNINNGIHYN